MKKFVTLILVFIGSVTTFANGLGEWNFLLWSDYMPLYIKFTFKGPLGLRDGASVNLINGNDTIYKFPLIVTNEELTIGWCSEVEANYQDDLYLPKGETYQIVIESDQIYNLDDPSKTNDKIVYEYAVPADLGKAYPVFDPEKPVTEMGSMGVEYGTETAVAEGGRVLFYREGVFVRDYPAYASWDWDLGFGGAKFERKLQFEKDVHYTMVIPEGTITSYWRPDIFNNEVVIDFFGGYPNLPTPVAKSWEISEAVVGPYMGYKLSFTYDTPVVLLPTKVISIMNEDGFIIDESRPTLEEKDGKHVLSALFTYLPEVGDRKWTAMIPEGTVVFKEGNMVVNHENRIDISFSSVNEIQSPNPTVEYAGDFIRVKGCKPGSCIALTSIDGRVVSTLQAVDNDMSIPKPSPGMYVISVNNRSQKIYLK